MAIIARKVVPVVFIISSIVISSVVAANCYTSDGTVDLNQQPCPGVNDTSPGSCCISTGWPNVDMCMSNGLCLSTVGGYMYTGACTDKDWSSEYCSLQRQCTDYYGTSYAVVTPCYTPQSTSGSVCCGYQGDSRTQSCCTNISGFNFSQDSTTSLFLGPMNASSLLNITTTVAALENHAGTSTESGNGSASVTETQYVTSSSIPSDYIKSSVAIDVGVGLGVPLLIALGSVAWLWMALDKQKQAYAQVQQADTAGPGQQLMQNHGHEWKAPISPPAELKATNEIQEVPSEPYRVEAPTERM